MRKLFLTSCLLFTLSLVCQANSNCLTASSSYKKVFECEVTTTYSYVDSKIVNGTIVTRWAWMRTDSNCKTSFGYLTVVGAGNPFQQSSVQWEDPEMIDALGNDRGLVENMIISKTQSQDFSSFTTNF